MTNPYVSAPDGIARFAVRGFFASSSASSNRFAAIATVRAVTMQTRINPICPQCGKPFHFVFAARKVLRNAKGNAKTECVILMSRAKITNR